MTATLTLRNENQKILFEGEIVGQISDGAWENSRPENHWRAWSNCDVKVAGEGDKIGRNFSVMKDNYNLTRSDLLEVVAERMINMVKIRKAYPTLPHEIVRTVADCSKEDIESYSGKYWKDVKREVEEYTTLDRIEEIKKSKTYTMQEMIQDLNEIKKAMRTGSREGIL